MGFTSGDPKSRLSAFKSGAVGESLILLGSIKGTLSSESELHSLLSRYKFKGEWFVYSKDVQSFVAKLLESEGVEC